MAGRAYSIFDTMIGRCGIAWSHAGVVRVQLPEAREIETRRRMLQQCPEARERKPPPEIEFAIEGIVALMRGRPCELSDVVLDTEGLPPFHRRVYDVVRGIPRGETRTYADIATKLGARGAIHAVGHAIARNPLAILVPCHRALAAAGETGGFAGNGGVVTKFRLLSIEGALTGGPTLMDVLFAAAPPRPQG